MKNKLFFLVLISLFVNPLYALSGYIEKRALFDFCKEFNQRLRTCDEITLDEFKKAQWKCDGVVRIEYENINWLLLKYLMCKYLETNKSDCANYVLKRISDSKVRWSHSSLFNEEIHPGILDVFLKFLFRSKRLIVSNCYWCRNILDILLNAIFPIFYRRGENAYNGEFDLKSIEAFFYDLCVVHKQKWDTYKYDLDWRDSSFDSFINFLEKENLLAGRSCGCSIWD